MSDKIRKNIFKEFYRIRENRTMRPPRLWEYAETLENVDWCCRSCKIIVDGGVFPTRCFMGSKHCGSCDGLLTRRTNGGQGDPFNYIPKLKSDKNE